MGRRSARTRRSHSRPALRPVLHGLAGLAIAIAPAAAQGYQLDVKYDEPFPQWMVLPFALYTAPLQLAYGIGGTTNGLGQPQLQFGGAAFDSTNDSTGLFLTMRGLQLAERWFVNADLSLGRLGQLRAYEDAPGTFTQPPPGSNRSSGEQFVQGDGFDSWAAARFIYVVPMGTGAWETNPMYRLDKGVLVDGHSGGWSQNPFESGLTTVSLEPRMRTQEINVPSGEDLRFNSTGWLLTVERHNEDWPINPTLGNYERVTWRQGFDATLPSETWGVIDGEIAGYIPLPETGWARQQVLALDWWTGWTPHGEAPYFDAPSLGGPVRLRGFPPFRFHDRAAIYYGAEYRWMPRFNPLEGIGVEWWQIVPFAEIGRVAPEYDFAALHTDMRYDAGLGFRFYTKNTLLRLDFAASDETSSVWVFFDQPFGFF